MKKLFNKPRWLKPEINEVKYHVHLVVLVLVILLGLKYVFGHDMLTWLWGLKFYIVLLAGDIIAHSVLQLD